MNTGAEDDSRSTPIFAFSASSARATLDAASVSTPATASRKIPFIRLPPTTLYSEPLRHLLVPADKSALLFQHLLQLSDGDVAWNRIARQRQRRGRPHRL